MCSVRSVAALLIVLAPLAGSSCKREGDTFLVVQAALDVPLAVEPLALEVTVRDAAARTASHRFKRDGEPLLPSSFSLQLPRDLASPLSIEVQAVSAEGAIQARGQLAAVDITAGGRREIQLVLRCLQGCRHDAGIIDAPPVTDGGATGGDGPRVLDGRGLCGNGQIDEGELCDPGILPGRWGACPPADCDDGLPCTEDIASGDGCQLRCAYRVRATTRGGDGCCPAGATAASDADCSATCGNAVVDPTPSGGGGETCDLAIASGAPGSCPSGCDDGNACTIDLLISSGTCAAACVHHPVLDNAAADGCCAPGSSSGADPDCPAVCGNGRKDPGETCDRGAPAGSPAACPSSCDDNDPCTADLLEGAGCKTACRNAPISDRVAGDRCCPPGASRDVDPDCPAICGNKIVEPGESCDKGLIAPAPGACPQSCPTATSACLTRRLEGRSDDCTARCTDDSGPALCSTAADGCCAERCTSGNDPDCSPTCGNGAVDAGETCDIAIAAGLPGACPSACADASACTNDVLVSRGTCHARCAYVPITSASSGDGCCPTGADIGSDRDCAAQCGDGLVSAPKETCDKAIAAGLSGACPGACPTAPGCNRLVLVGDASSCTSRCASEPVKACSSGDGCCPAGCTARSDGDCPAICGNGEQESGEACDKGISTGLGGSCAASCNDNNSCTADVTLGRVSDCSRVCRNEPITTCRSGDGCCPAGCQAPQDLDCLPRCGNGTVEAGETCDPPSACPVTCPDDKDPCTTQRLLGDAATCSAVCLYAPILLCSGKSPDKCCPSICSAALDVDCSAPTIQNGAGAF